MVMVVVDFGKEGGFKRWYKELLVVVRESVDLLVGQGTLVR
jgi:hypothetical protein